MHLEGFLNGISCRTDEQKVIRVVLDVKTEPSETRDERLIQWLRKFRHGQRSTAVRAVLTAYASGELVSKVDDDEFEDEFEDEF